MMWTAGGQIDHLTFAGLRGGGKGGSKPQTTTTQTTSTAQLPPWLDAASQQAVGMAQDLSQRPYDPYTGQIVAGTTPAQQQAYQEIQNLQGTTAPAFQSAQQAYQPLLGELQPQTAGGITDPTNQLYQNYQQQVMSPAAGLLGGYLQGGPSTAGQVGANAMTLMSPYEAAVINPALQAGQQQLALANQQIAGQAQNVGAFGGSRQGVQQGVAEAQTALGTQGQIANLLNQGWQAAMPAAQAIALQAGQQGYGAAGGLAGMAQQGYAPALTAGQSLANTNLNLGVTAAQQLPQLATGQLADAQKEASLLQTVGSAQQQQQQAELNAQMGQFYQQQDWPIQNLDILLGAVGGVPYGTTTQGLTTAQQQQQRNLLGGMVGGAASGASIGSTLSGGNPLMGGIGAGVGGILGAL